MTKEQAIYEAHQRGHELLTPAKKTVAGKPSYICPLCENGTGADGDGIVEDKQGYYKCFVCDFYGDIVEIVKQSEGVDTGEAFQRVYQRLGIYVDYENEGFSPEKKKSYTTQAPMKRPEPQAPQQQPPKLPEVDFIQFYEECIARLRKSPIALDYLRNRGLSERVILEYGLGYDGKNIVVPSSVSLENHCYLLRGIGSNFKGNGKGSILEPFNLQALEQKEPVFVTEGEFDALSVIEAGGQAVGLGSASNVQKFLEYLKNVQNAPHLIISLDNDTAGGQATKRLISGLNALGKSFSIENINGTCKDQNEALTSNRALFLQEVARAKDRAKRPDNMIDYLQDNFSEDVRIFNKGATRKTGYTSLDEQIGGLYTGLYVLGAISSLGKTTFIHQMADQLAERGEHVLFFSLEQSRMELLSKSLARGTLGVEKGHYLTGIQIRQGQTNDTLEQVKGYYTQHIAPRMSIIESNFNCTVQVIKEKVKQYKANNPDTFPVVIVDYLQILQPSQDLQRASTKEATDYNVTELKRLSRDEDIVVIAVSSVNRSNYLAPIDFESFKESGGIEFTADVVWGLQLEAINQSEFSSDKKTIEKRKIIMEAKKADPREIELVCLKNRFGVSSYTKDFDYIPKYDFFSERR